MRRSRFHKFTLNWDQSFGRHVWKSPGDEWLPGRPGEDRLSCKSWGDDWYPGTPWHGCTKKGCTSKADQWCIFNREDAVFFAQTNFLPALRPRCLFVDEHYFINMMTEYERKFENNTVTHTEWVPFTSSPIMFDECLDANVVEKARNEGALFIRKVSQNAKLPANYKETLVPGKASVLWSEDISGTFD